MNTAKLKRHILNLLKTTLSPQLTYHSVNHTMRVISICEQYIKRLQLSPADAYLLRTAAILHDSGFLRAYDNHEEESVKFAREILPTWNYSSNEIEKIAGMIRATKIPQTPTNLSEQILCDSDLDYLGTDLFDSIGNHLFNELLSFGKIADEKEWTNLQIRFIGKHTYHTPFAIKYREPVKLAHLKRLIEKPD